jgi:ACR3 family arsenite efflux pump ArsB
VEDALAIVFFATCGLAKQFLQAMAGVESMTVAINPADNSLIVVIELPLGIQQTTRDYPSRVERVWLQGAAIVSLFGVPQRA